MKRGDRDEERERKREREREKEKEKKERESLKGEVATRRSSSSFLHYFVERALPTALVLWEGVSAFEGNSQNLQIYVPWPSVISWSAATRRRTACVAVYLRLKAVACRAEQSPVRGKCTRERQTTKKAPPTEEGVRRAEDLRHDAPPFLAFPFLSLTLFRPPHAYITHRRTTRIYHHRLSSQPRHSQPEQANSENGLLENLLPLPLLPPPPPPHRGPCHVLSVPIHTPRPSRGRAGWEARAAV